jgi:hypothetical protein
MLFSCYLTGTIPVTVFWVFWTNAEVIRGKKWVDCIGVLQEVWPIRVREKGAGIDLG